MKKQDLELLVQAGDVQNVVISRDSSAAEWELWAYGGSATDSRGNRLSTARGEPRLFRTLDTAFSFVTGCGFRGPVSVEERFSKGA